MTNDAILFIHRIVDRSLTPHVTAHQTTPLTLRNTLFKSTANRQFRNATATSLLVRRRLSFVRSLIGPSHDPYTLETRIVTTSYVLRDGRLCTISAKLRTNSLAMTDTYLLSVFFSDGIGDVRDVEIRVTHLGDTDNPQPTAQQMWQQAVHLDVHHFDDLYDRKLAARPSNDFRF